MKTSLKRPSDTKVLLTVTLNKEELASAELVALSRLAANLKIPGFRPGKAPASVAMKHVNPAALAEQTANEAISKAVALGFMQSKLHALERPQVAVTKFVPGESMEFTAEADVMPEVKLGNYKALGVKKPIVKVTEKDVEDVVERLRTNGAIPKEVNRPARDGDEVIIDFTGKLGDQLFEGGSAQNYSLKLGSSSFIPGFEEGIVGKKAGESFDLAVTFPKEYPAAHLAGQEATFSIMLHKVNETVLPELNDEFASKAGNVNTLEELTKTVREELTAEKERQALEAYRNLLVEQLAETSTAPVPEVLISDQMVSMEKDVQQNLMYRGRSLDDYLKAEGYASRDAWMTAKLRPAAEKRVKAGLALAELSRQEKIGVSDEAIQARLDTYKDQYKKDPRMIDQFSTSEARQDMTARITTEKTIDRLVELNS